MHVISPPNYNVSACLLSSVIKELLTFTSALSSKTLQALSWIVPTFKMPTFWFVGTLPHARGNTSEPPYPTSASGQWFVWPVKHVFREVPYTTEHARPSINLRSCLGYSLKQFAMISKV